MDNRNMLLLDQGLVLFVDDGLMVLVNVLFHNDWLMMFMDNFLMMLMEDVLLVLNEYVFVMLVDEILMDFLDDRLGNFDSHISGEFVSFDCLTFVGLLEDGLLLMADDNWLLVDLLYNDITLDECSWCSSESSDTLCVHVLSCSSSHHVSLLEISGTCSSHSSVYSSSCS